MAKRNNMHDKEPLINCIEDIRDTTFFLLKVILIIIIALYSIIRNTVNNLNQGI